MRFKFASALAVLVVAFAISAVAAASASAALPELVNKEGKALVKNKFAGKLPEVEQTIRFVAGRSHKLWCEAGTVAGDFSGLKAGEETFALTNCKDSGGKCFESNGELHNNLTIPFSLTLVYLSKASKELALLLTLHETFSAKCGGGTASISGDFLVPIPSYAVNKLRGVTEYLRLNPREASSGKQEVKQYENEKGEKVETHLKLNLGEEEECSVQFETETLFEEAAEFKG
jgi:hypothetical protein